jgi:dihydropteroate synthase
MGPVLRISRGGTLTITLSGLTHGQSEALRKLFPSFDRGADLRPAPSFYSEPNLSSASQDHVLTGSLTQLKYFARILSTQESQASDLSRKIDSLLDNYTRSDYKIDCRGKVLDLGSHTHIMGILNATPDSFSDGGKFAAEQQALAHAREMAALGADIIDIGGESTRPGAEPVPEDEELRRIIPLIEKLSNELTIPLSVDTYKSSVAEKALQAGASIVNDISGLRYSPDMAKVVADHGAGLIIMHIKGTPRNMQQNPAYADVVQEISDYLEQGVELAVTAGVDQERIMIDPGIGFGKTLEHNLTIMARLDEFRSLGRPIVLGTSRKKFIGTVLDQPVPEERLFGTAATTALGIERGARILRVHDVTQMKQVARMTDEILKNK